MRRASPGGLRSGGRDPIRRLDGLLDRLVDLAVQIGPEGLVLPVHPADALLDGLRPSYSVPSSPDQKAFHEGFSDVVALLSRRVRVHALVLESPALHLVRHADGTTNLDGLVAAHASDSGPAPLDVDLESFHVANGRVLLDDEGASRRTTLTVSTDLALHMREHGVRLATQGTTTVSGLAWGPLSATGDEQLEHGLSALTVRLEHDGAFDARSQRLALARLAVRLGRATLEGTGRIDSVASHPRFDLRVSGTDLALDQVLAWAAVADAHALQGLSGRGSLAFDLRAIGAVGGTPSLRGWCTLRDGVFRRTGVQATIEGLALRLDCAPDSLVLREVRARLGGGGASERTAQLLAEVLA